MRPRQFEAALGERRHRWRLCDSRFLPLRRCCRFVDGTIALLFRLPPFGEDRCQLVRGRPGDSRTGAGSFWGDALQPETLQVVVLPGPELRGTVRLVGPRGVNRQTQAEAQPACLERIDSGNPYFVIPNFHHEVYRPRRSSRVYGILIPSLQIVPGPIPERPPFGGEGKRLAESTDFVGRYPSAVQLHLHQTPFSCQFPGRLHGRLRTGSPRFRCGSPSTRIRDESAMIGTRCVAFSSPTLPGQQAAQADQEQTSA